MCNLGEGIWEKAIMQGREECAIEIITRMNQQGFSLKQISDVMEKSPDEVKAILESKG